MHWLSVDGKLGPATLMVMENLQSKANGCHLLLQITALSEWDVPPLSGAVTILGWSGTSPAHEWGGTIPCVPSTTAGLFEGRSYSFTSFVSSLKPHQGKDKSK